MPKAKQNSFLTTPSSSSACPSVEELSFPDDFCLPDDKNSSILRSKLQSDSKADRDSEEELTEKERQLEEWKAKQTHEEKYKVYRMCGEEPNILLNELRPGKKGGDFTLPFGGWISVPDSSAGKKDTITICCVSTSERHKYMPRLKKGESLLSEIYLFAVSPMPLRREAVFRFPYHECDADMTVLDVIWRKSIDVEWESKEFAVMHKKLPMVEIRCSCNGMFAVILRPKQERFTLPSQGCLYNVHLHHQVSVRAPKKASDIDLNVTVQVTPFPIGRLEDIRAQFQNDLSDLIAVSDFVDIVSQPEVAEFKRSLTIKMPLPHMDSEDFQQDDIAVLYMQNKEWKLLDSLLRFGKSSLTFDSNKLSRFVVALSKPERRKRLPIALNRIEEQDDTVGGVILPFLYLQDVLWSVVVEIVPKEQADELKRVRDDEGFVLLKPNPQHIPVVEPKPKKPFSRKGATPQNQTIYIQAGKEEIDLREGDCFEIELAGDLVVDDNDLVKQELFLFYNKHLPRNFKRFVVLPKVNKFFYNLEDANNLKGLLKFYRAFKAPCGVMQKELLNTYTFEISAERLAKILYVPPDTVCPDPDSETSLTDIIGTKIESKKKVTTVASAPPVPAPVRRVSSETFARLCTPHRPPRHLVKEAKVLSGKSLQILARLIGQGLTLAIHLDISDSSITGLGFDALSNGFNVFDITYRMLMYWKRKTSHIKERQVDILTKALRTMGEDMAANILLECHKTNREMNVNDLGFAHHSAWE